MKVLNVCLFELKKTCLDFKFSIEKSSEERNFQLAKITISLKSNMWFVFLGFRILEKLKDFLIYVFFFLSRFARIFTLVVYFICVLLYKSFSFQDFFFHTNLINFIIELSFLIFYLRVFSQTWVAYKYIIECNYLIDFLSMWIVKKIYLNNFYFILLKTIFLNFHFLHLNHFIFPSLIFPLNLNNVYSSILI